MKIAVDKHRLPANQGADNPIRGASHIPRRTGKSYRLQRYK